MVGSDWEHNLSDRSKYMADLYKRRISGGISKTATVSSSKDYQLIATIKAYKNDKLVDIDYKTDYYLN